MAVAGCGGGGITTKEFRARANAICADGDRQVGELGTASRRLDAEEAVVFRKIGRILSMRVAKLEKLRVPKAAARTYRRMLVAYVIGASNARAVAGALKASDRRATALAASDYTTAIGEAQSFADEIGLDGCHRFGLPAGN